MQLDENERPAGGDAADGAGGDAGDGTAGRGGESWWSSKSPVFRFVFGFAVLMVLFNGFYYVWFSKSGLFRMYLALNAELSGAVLRLFGDRATVTGTSIVSPRFSLEIKDGCDAVQASAFFVFAVLASPVSVTLPRRLRTVVLGTLVLLTINLARIVSLYYIGIYYPNAFETMHVAVWQAGFIFLPIFFWLVWLRLALRQEAPSPDVSA